MNELLLEPLKYYDKVGKQTHEENAKQHFTELFEKSKVNAEENRKTVKKYDAECTVIANLSKRLKKYKVFKVLLIIGIVIGVILTLLTFAFLEDWVTALILFSVGTLFIVGSALLLKKKVNPTIKNTEAEHQLHSEIADGLLQMAWGQMQPLNDLFTDRDTINLIEKTLPQLSFDEKFTKEQEDLFISKYDFTDLQTWESSMVDTLSGKFAGNPFLFGRRRVHTMGSETYTGTLTISWVETYRDSQGRTQRRHRSQTLTATVTKPKPYYHYHTFLAYGNQAAPDLSFSRESKHLERFSEQSLEKKVKRGERKLQRKAEKALKKGESFQGMANTEFDVLFGAHDRNHEVQFRLMYTPLAQKNTVALLTDKGYYGDDFDFRKTRRCNLIVSDHAQHWTMNTSAENYRSYDIDQAERNFVTFNTEFFKSVFFDFAPLLSVPVYTEEPCASLEKIEEYPCNYTYYEHEVMANALGYRNFVHESSHTEAILKTQLLSKEGNVDRVEVTANSYTTYDRVDYIPVRGGDGRLHSVPVHWVEYIPVSRTTQVKIKESSRGGQDVGTHYHGMNIYTI